MPCEHDQRQLPTETAPDEKNEETAHSSMQQDPSGDREQRDIPLNHQSDDRKEDFEAKQPQGPTPTTTPPLGANTIEVCLEKIGCIPAT